jgi:hypothetical protein
MSVNWYAEYANCLVLSFVMLITKVCVPFPANTLDIEELRTPNKN